MIRPQGGCSLRNMGSIFYCLFIRPRPHVFGYFLKRTFFFVVIAFRLLVNGFFGHQNGRVFKTRGPRGEIFENAGFSFTFRWTKTEVFVYNDLIHHVLVALRMLCGGYKLSYFYNLAFSSGYANTQHATYGGVFLENICFQKISGLESKGLWFDHTLKTVS